MAVAAAAVLVGIAVSGGCAVTVAVFTGATVGLLVTVADTGAKAAGIVGVGWPSPISIPGADNGREQAARNRPR